MQSLICYHEMSGCGEEGCPCKRVAHAPGKGAQVGLAGPGTQYLESQRGRPCGGSFKSGSLYCAIWSRELEDAPKKGARHKELEEGDLLTVLLCPGEPSACEMRRLECWAWQPSLGVYENKGTRK